MALTLTGADVLLLGYARDRRLLAVTDVVDRPHVLWTAADGTATELAPVEAEAVRQMVIHAVLPDSLSPYGETHSRRLVQLGAAVESLPWHGQTAHGRRVLLTDTGRAVLDTALAVSPGVSRDWSMTPGAAAVAADVERARAIAWAARTLGGAA
ncbi:hypothetical protein Acsp05_71460 [Actinokineospora sp. NBRC 105648]|nr:hypothetical protein Acsp05_71460 [Actinokineospora sp. NBRC 105648]